MNIILVIFDSLRKDCVGAYGSPPWWNIRTPNFDAFAKDSLMMTRAYPESLPTLPTRRAIYTGRRVYPFHNDDFRLKGDFVGAPGWGPIPEEQSTLSEILHEAGYRTALIADVFHMFKPSKNFTRGFDQWTFLRGRETDPARSGPSLPDDVIDHWLPKHMQSGWAKWFLHKCLMNMHGRTLEEDYFSPRVLREAATWLQQNRDADKFFLTIESFDPHEPWLVPEHYRRMYQPEDGPEQVMSNYDSTAWMPPEILKRTRANYSGSVTLCDRWFGFFMEQLRVMGLLDDTMVIFTSDHGHSIGDNDFLGKRGYPSSPDINDVPLMIRFPGAEHAGTTSDMFVQHTDITAAILDATGVEPPDPIDGLAFLQDALAGKPGGRDHITTAWGSAVTVITDRWWLNCKVDGTGALLHDLKADAPFARNVANENPDTVRELFGLAEQDAAGGFPEWLLDLARNEADAPGCSDMASRE